jgi:MFS transporter, SP family, general alpha glucoside:H+ symporter
MTIAVPYMINPDEADLAGKIGFFFGGLATLSFSQAYLRIPKTVSLHSISLDCSANQNEQKNRTYEELDIMFTRGVRARDFSRYTIS